MRTLQNTRRLQETQTVNYRERMNVKVSAAETAILQRLNSEGVFPLTQKPFCLRHTTPDLFFPDINLAIYIDGEQVHLNKEERDMELRRLLKKRHGCKVRSYTYKAPITKAKLEEIVGSILDNVKGYRRDMK